MNDEAEVDENGEGEQQQHDVPPFRQQYAAVVLQLKSANKQVEEALLALRQRNRYREVVVKPGSTSAWRRQLIEQRGEQPAFHPTPIYADLIANARRRAREMVHGAEEKLRGQSMIPVKATTLTATAAATTQITNVSHQQQSTGVVAVTAPAAVGTAFGVVAKGGAAQGLIEQKYNIGNNAAIPRSINNNNNGHNTNANQPPQQALVPSGAANNGTPNNTATINNTTTPAAPDASHTNKVNTIGSVPAALPSPQVALAVPANRQSSTRALTPMDSAQLGGESTQNHKHDERGTNEEANHVSNNNNGNNGSIPPHQQQQASPTAMDVDAPPLQHNSNNNRTAVESTSAQLVTGSATPAAAPTVTATAAAVVAAVVNGQAPVAASMPFLASHALPQGPCDEQVGQQYQQQQ